MLAFPNAKINLGLHILQKRVDGYHEIETLFYPIGLCDVLEITPLRGIKRVIKEAIFETTGLDLGGNKQDNLVMKAWKEVKKSRKIPPTRIHLHKIIPPGSGLGGGSSDASHLLKRLNSLYELQLSDEELLEMASSLGSDCPFFLLNSPAIGKGTGIELEPSQVNLTGYYLYLVCPGIGINTGMAYSKSRPAIPERSLKEVISQPIETWRENMVNDFEKPVFEMFPELSFIKDALYDAGSLYASMSGSGSAVYGIFNKKPEKLRFHKDYFVWQEFL